ncbi:PAS domain S-box protein [Cyanobacteria bacterium FACHB-DQ100]|uniref:PAS domain-containing sensor histidine kinase n=1 Tax=Leptolyngbya sp. DQ-M1 TaxID=2933920 RepID=UPI00199E7E78|nr:PAS domain S-box protein [Cyanobacteria bacterium FACHB-DQ100]
MNESKNIRDRQKLIQQLETVDQQFNQLYQAADKTPSATSDASFPEYLSALSEALEELKVIEEEICEQNQQLSETRQALEAEQRRYEELFDFAPDGYLITDKHGKIQEANRVACELLQIEKKYIVGKVLINFIAEEHRNVFQSLLLQLQSIDRVREWEISFVARNGARFEAALTIVAVKTESGETVALRWLLRDITNRKQIEEQLRKIQLQNLELIESDRLKEQFIATMSHELRTPLTAILGFSDLLLRQFHRQIPPHQMKLIERIFENGRHLLSLIEDILDFSNLRTKQIELQLAAFDLNELVTQTVQEMHSLAAQKNLSIHTHLAPNNPILINDRARVKQILVNLISNAIKFTDSGSVCVQVQSGKYDRIQIVVQDTGMGIDDSEFATIFQEFRQINQTSTRQHGGTGLGLAITKALTELMGGEVSVQSKLGLGSTFTIELPSRVSRP